MTFVCLIIYFDVLMDKLVILKILIDMLTINPSFLRAILKLLVKQRKSLG